MPIEIKELVIRATIENGNTNSPGVQVTTGDGNSRIKSLNDRVDELIKLIKEKNER